MFGQAINWCIDKFSNFIIAYYKFELFAKHIGRRTFTNPINNYPLNSSLKNDNGLSTEGSTSKMVITILSAIAISRDLANEIPIILPHALKFVDVWVNKNELVSPYGILDKEHITKQFKSHKIFMLPRVIIINW